MKQYSNYNYSRLDLNIDGFRLTTTNVKGIESEKMGRKKEMRINEGTIKMTHSQYSLILIIIP